MQKDWKENYGQGVSNARPRSASNLHRAPILTVPAQGSYWTMGSAVYWGDHGISLDFVDRITSVYPSYDGIVFRLRGGHCPYQHRYTNGREPRFESAPGGDTGSIFVPALRQPGHALLTEVLAVCEGPADAIGILQEQVGSFALLGSAITNDRLATVTRLWRDKGCPPIAYVMDSDRAGWAGFDTLCQLAGSHGLPDPLAWILPPGIKDFCGVRRGERAGLVQSWLHGKYTLERRP